MSAISQPTSQATASIMEELDRQNLVALVRHLARSRRYCELETLASTAIEELDNQCRFRAMRNVENDLRARAWERLRQTQQRSLT